jgi:DNA-binding NarL/FixJ family response regulator
VISALVADDQALVRAGFAMMLDAEPDIEVVGEAGNGREAVHEVLRLHPDVVLMDVRMPQLDGIQATAELARARSAARVLILTTFHVDSYVYAALKAGASGFLLKDVDPPDLVAAVRCVAKGEALLAPAVTRRLIEQHVQRPAPSAFPAAARELTERELEVLRLIARGRSNVEIGSELFLAEPTVKTHVTRMLRKLGLRDRVQAVVFAYESGLVEPGAAHGPAQRTTG